jgi:hypothetical protein
MNGKSLATNGGGGNATAAPAAFPISPLASLQIQNEKKINHLAIN